MKAYIVEAIEGEITILLPRNDENERVIVQAGQLPAGIKDGDIIEAEISDESRVVEYKLLTEETKEVVERNQGLLDKILRDKK
ncbi:DUF3006 domain-containing protein [Bacillus infantis]|uniref:DUF3006 family protein n=1 Tax=Bacillus infantis TaxID=324767 RepID=UPI001CD319AA|nr:DUF3006 family protein [Bacillus infantis]MCA1040944.1 DUF3006 domain-containing protein [Bacillus infantis]